MPTAQAQSETREPESDQQLMAAYLRGDERAFRLLFERYAPVLRRYFVCHGKSSCDAADLVQQTFLRLHRSRADFSQSEALRPWLFTIARNLRYDHSRRCQRRPELYCDLDLTACPEEPSSSALLQEERASALGRALDSLPHEQQDLLREHWLKERSWIEIAAGGGALPGTLRVRAHRACLQLRDQLASAA